MNNLSNEPGLRDRQTMRKAFLYDYKTDSRYSATPDDYWNRAPDEVLRSDRRNLWLIETETDGINVQARIILRKVRLVDLVRYQQRTRGDVRLRSWEDNMSWDGEKKP